MKAKKFSSSAPARRLVLSLPLDLSSVRGQMAVRSASIGGLSGAVERLYRRVFHAVTVMISMIETSSPSDRPGTREGAPVALIHQTIVSGQFVPRPCRTTGGVAAVDWIHQRCN